MQHQKPTYRSIIQLQNSTYLNSAGTVLVYVVVLMLIFGILGVVMVSLFSTSIASSITRNDSRRAQYMAESGMRFAFSELRRTDFDINYMIDPLSTTTYNVTDGGSFSINVFSPWFESPATQSIDPGPGSLSLNVPIGELPDGFTIPANNIFAINYEFTGNRPNDESGSWAPVTNFNEAAPSLTLSDDFNASSDERISLAVHPILDQPIIEGGDLIVSLEAQTIFPKYGGAISINRNDYFYEQRIDDPDNNRVILRDLSKRPESVFGITATTADFVILSPRNYMVVPTGESDGTTYGGDFTIARGIFDSSLPRPDSAPPDITADEFTSNLSEQEDNTQFFETDPVADELRIGSGLSDQFGSALYSGDESIGGDQDYCEQGACLFGPGVRAFFLVNFSQQGEGITFTLLGKGFTPPATPNNSAGSVGGDIELSELMGYAGDSRLDAAGTSFIATDPDNRGLDPPKIAVEFDTRTNNRIDDPPPDYCAGLNVETNLRNDPLTGNKDAVQYVFWGRENFLNIPCRGNSPLYDDNRHDAFGEEPTEEWRFGTGGPVSVWRPAIGSDGTIYMSDQVDTLYALNEDGTTKWTFNLIDGNDYMPAVDPDTGTIYSDIFGSALVAINPNGTERWRFVIAPSTDIKSTPTVGPDGVIYFGTNLAQALIALNPNGTEKWRFTAAGE
ncbi:MAG: PQQ-binding-like beta-propeller repeat protein, partial [Desulfobacterales bacterium]